MSDRNHHKTHGKRVTQQELANILGVDRTTISKILSGDRRTTFSPELVRRVRAAAQRYHYKNLRSPVKEVAFVSDRALQPTLHPIHFRLLSFICGINDALTGQSCKLTLVDPTHDPVPLLSMADGIIFLECKHLDLLEGLAEVPHRYIVINRILPGYAGPYVIHETDTVYGMIADYLRQRGHREATYLAAPEDSLPVARLARVEEQCRSRGLHLRSDLALLQNQDIESLAAWAHQLVAQRVTAVIAAHDMVAHMFINAALKAGVEVPTQISVIGNNRVPYPEGVGLPIRLTSVVVPWYELARRAGEIMADAIRRNTAVTAQEVIPATIYEQDSVATLPA